MIRLTGETRALPLNDSFMDRVDSRNRRAGINANAAIFGFRYYNEFGSGVGKMLSFIGHA